MAAELVYGFPITKPNDLFILNIKSSTVNTNYISVMKYSNAHDDDKHSVEYRIVDVVTCDTIDKIYRDCKDDQPFFVYVNHSCKDYIITSRSPETFTVICVTDHKSYDRTLTVGGKRAFPVDVDVCTKIDSGLVNMTFLCKMFDENGSYEYKNVSITVDCLDNFEFPKRINIDDSNIIEEKWGSYNVR